MIEGTVSNGRRVPIRLEAFDGMAGVRTRPAGVEVAYTGKAPRRLPCALTIDGEAYTATARLNSRVNGIVILFAEPAAA